MTESQLGTSQINLHVKILWATHKHSIRDSITIWQPLQHTCTSHHTLQNPERHVWDVSPDRWRMPRRQSERSHRSTESSRSRTQSFHYRWYSIPCCQCQQTSSNAAGEIIRDARRKKSKRLFLISLSLATFSLGCFLSIHLLWGYKALLPWKCKRLCWDWPALEWWKRLEDGPPTAVLVSGPVRSSRLTDSHWIESKRRRVGFMRTHVCHKTSPSSNIKHLNWEQLLKLYNDIIIRHHVHFLGIINATINTLHTTLKKTTFPIYHCIVCYFINKTQAVVKNLGCFREHHVPTWTATSVYFTMMQK